jgi:hypothetical protein
MTPREMTHEEKHAQAMREIEMSRQHAGMMFRHLCAMQGGCRIEHGTTDCVTREMVRMTEAG